MKTRRTALEQLAALEVADSHLREKVGEVLGLFGGTIAPAKPSGHLLRREASGHRHAATCREEILSAFGRLERRHGRRVFSPGEAIQEVTAATDRYPEQTIRTEIVSRMCADAPVHHATAYADLERVSRGQYRRRTSPASQLEAEAAGDNSAHSARR